MHCSIFNSLFDLSLSTDKLKSFNSILYSSLPGYSLHYYWSVLVVVLICSSNCQSSAIQFEDRLIPCRPDFSRQTFLSGNGYYLFSHFKQLIMILKAANPNEILTSVLKIKFHFLIKALRLVFHLILSLVNKSRSSPPTRSTL